VHKTINNPLFMQMLYEILSWPYDWPNSEDYLISEERGAVSGKLLVKDWLVWYQLFVKPM
jgi:hypothetical protein